MLKKVFTWGVVLSTIVWAFGLAAFVPVAQAADAGDLIKASGAAVYYYAGDGKRYVFPNERTYFSWYSDFSMVTTISDSELAAIPIGGNVVMREGTYLAKITTDPKVYAIEPGGELRWIETEALAIELYGADWASRVVDVPDAFFTNYTVGTSISTAEHPDGTLIMYTGDSKTYLIVDGPERRWIADEAAFNANHYRWEFVVDTDILYTDGGNITGMESVLFDPSNGSAMPVVEGDLTVSVASTTPAATSVPIGANADFTKFTFTAGDTDVQISKIYITRYGLSANADLANLKWLDEDGVQYGNTVGNLNSDGTATLAFTSPVTVPANTSKDYIVRSGIAATATAANTVGLGIDSADDIVSNASVASANSSAVAGSFPLVGNYMTIVGTTIGSVSVTNDGTVTDSTPDAGDENILTNKWKVTVGATEGVVIDTITLLETGTAGLSDTANIDLWDVTGSAMLGTVAAWNNEGKAVFGSINVPVDKGDSNRFKSELDIVSGAGLTVNTDLTDGGDVLMSAYGDTYGYYITPAVTGGWNGQGANNQTINNGALNITKSTSTPPTGNVVEGDDQLLTVWDFEAKGEPVVITNTTLTITHAGGSETDGADFINCVLKDDTGSVVAGPQNSTDAADTVVFTDTYTVPVGINEYSAECTIFDSDDDDWLSATGDDTFNFGIAAAGNVTAKGFNTNSAIVPGGSFAANGNNQTIKAGLLTATTLTEPAARNIVPGSGDVLWMTASLSAAGSGEDVIIDTLIVEDNYTDGGGSGLAMSALDNLEVWADLDANGTFETKVTDTQNPTGAGGTATYQHTFNMSPTFTSVKDDEIRVGLYGDLATGALAGDIHQVRLDLVATGAQGTGAVTGNAITDTPAGNGQAFTVVANGALTVSVDSSSPEDYAGTDDHLIQGKASMVTLGVFRLTETTGAEDLELDQLTITDDGSDTVISKYYLFADERFDGGSVSDPIATATPAAGVAQFFISDGVVKAPSDDNVLLTVKGDAANVDGTTVAEEDRVEVTIANATTGVVMTGLGSGQVVNGAAANYDAASFIALSSVPSVAFADGWTDAYSKNLNTGTSVQVASIAVTAGSKDITFVNGDPALFSIQISGSASGGDAAADENVVFKSGAGTTLDTVAAEIDNGVVTTQVDCDFSTNNWTVPATLTKYLNVFANTSGYTTAGDSLQVWLDDVGADVTFSINLDGGTYDYGDILNRGDRYGASFTK